MPDKRIGKYEPTTERIDEAGKGNLDDEMLPNKGEPMPQQESGGEETDSAGEHGRMAVETADSIERKAREDQR